MSTQSACGYVYEDGDYARCAECDRAKHCKNKNACAIYGNTDSVFYDKKTDLFLCSRCCFLCTK